MERTPLLQKRLTMLRLAGNCLLGIEIDNDTLAWSSVLVVADLAPSPGPLFGPHLILSLLILSTAANSGLTLQKECHRRRFGVERGVVAQFDGLDIRQYERLDEA